MHTALVREEWHRVTETVYELGLPVEASHEEPVEFYVCPEHGTEMAGGTTQSLGTETFCAECAEELKALLAKPAAANWTRTDQEMLEDERAEREMFARLER